MLGEYARSREGEIADLSERIRITFVHSTTPQTSHTPYRQPRYGKVLSGLARLRSQACSLATGDLRLETESHDRPEIQNAFTQRNFEIHSSACRPWVKRRRVQEIESVQNHRGPQRLRTCQVSTLAVARER
jgi:hypothetical protein